MHKYDHHNGPVAWPALIKSVDLTAAKKAKANEFRFSQVFTGPPKVLRPRQAAHGFDICTAVLPVNNSHPEAAFAP